MFTKPFPDWHFPEVLKEEVDSFSDCLNAKIKSLWIVLLLFSENVEDSLDTFHKATFGDTNMAVHLALGVVSMPGCITSMM